jgi:hypothetical protein
MEPDESALVLKTSDVTELLAEIPDGHHHLRTTITLADGRSITLQEATVAAIVRAYTRVKTDPLRRRVQMKGRLLAERKDGFAEWQLLEEPDGN